MPKQGRVIPIEVVGAELPEQGADAPLSVGMQAGDEVVQLAPVDAAVVAFSAHAIIEDVGEGKLRVTGPFVHGSAPSKHHYLVWLRNAESSDVERLGRLKIELADAVVAGLNAAGSGRVTVSLTDPRGRPLCGSARDRATWEFGVA